MKKKLALSIFMICIFLLAQPVFAFESETYLMNADGSERAEAPSIETGKNLDLGKIRIREAAYTIGKLEEGDRIALVLSNASFVETPLLLNPPISSGNPRGQTGDFNLVQVPGTGRPGDNAIVYELQKKPIFTADDRRLDYVVHFKNIKADKEADVKVSFIAGTQDDTIDEPILAHKEVLLAKVFTVVPDSIVKKSYFTHEIISRELNENFAENTHYTFKEKDIQMEVPKKFFQQGDMLGTLNDERWTFRVVANEAGGMRISNPDFSTEVGAPIREFLFYKIDAFGGYSDTLAQKNFEPVKVTFKNLNTGSHKPSEFIPVRYVENADGTYTKTLITKGSYDYSKKEYSFYVSAPGIYTVEQKQESTKTISMKINDFFAIVNNSQVQLDAAPQTINDSTYVPVRFIAENLGATVEFIQASNQVEIKTADKTIYLPIDQVTTGLATPARIVDGRTLVPVRYVSEQLGATVSWLPESQTINILK